MAKISIRFFNDREARAVWDDATNGCFFSVLDVVGVLTNICASCISYRKKVRRLDFLKKSDVWLFDVEPLSGNSARR
jgi:hypothetical protein